MIVTCFNRIMISDGETAINVGPVAIIPIELEFRSVEILEKTLGEEREPAT